MKENIPLSWSYKKVESPRFHSINLPLSGLPWIYTAEIQDNYKIEELVYQLESLYTKGFLLRGCSPEIASYLQKKNYEIIRTGAEGVLDLDNIDQVSKSLSELVQRGSRFGVVTEVALTKANCQRVANFVDQTPYGSKPHLKYLFNNNFDSNTRCFVMNSFQNNWLGVITVSASGQNSCHTEMILRNKKAPVGSMEALFISVMNILKDEGCKFFSLGEVPFVTSELIKNYSLESSMKRSLQEYMLFKSGHVLRYAFNYEGLFNFKNKFNPTWKPVYICATPRLPFLCLIDLFYKSGYMNLSRSELTATFKSYYQLSSSSS